MKSVDKKEVISSQSAEFIKQGEEGKFLKMVSDTFIIKMEGGAQGYAIRHLNMKDMLLIDTTGKGAEKGIKHLVEEGYKIKAILITNKEALRNTYAPLKTISEDAGGAPVFVHPVNSSDTTFAVKDITARNDVFEHFSIAVDDFPSASGESSVIYCGINEGMVFAGNSALGSGYDEKEEKIHRPDLKSENKNFSLAESWRTYIREFRYFFPYRGKPQFNLEEGEQTDLIQKLGSLNYPGGGNPNL